MKLDVKRLYLPGFVIRATCPQCGVVVEHDMDDRYLSFPSTDADIVYGMLHEAESPDGKYDEHAWDVKVRLVVQLVAVEGCTVEVET